MEDWDSLQNWSTNQGRMGETMTACNDWNRNNNTNMVNFGGRSSQYCSECGAKTWNSCMCLGSMDPEDEDPMDCPMGSPARRDAVGSERMTVSVGEQYQSETCAAATNHGTVPCDNATLPRTSMTKPAVQEKAPGEASDDQESIMTRLNKLHTSLDDIKKDKEAMKQNLGESCLTFLHELKSFRKKITDHFDNMEKKAKTELNSLYEKLDQNLRDDISCCDKAREELQKISESLETDGNVQSHNLNASMDIIERKLANAKEVIKDLSKSDSRCKFKFVFHPTLQSVSNNVTSLGRFQFEQQQEETDPVESKDLSDNRDVNVRLSSDKQSCCISGMCQLPDGRTLIVDRDNQNLKCLDEDFKITHCCELSAKPRGVCCVRSAKAATQVTPQTFSTQQTFPHYTVAVSLSNNTVQYVGIRGTEVTLGVSMSFGHQCWGLACLGDKLYISDWGSNVYVYDLSGTSVRTITKDQFGRNIFTNSRQIAVNEMANEVYVCDRVKGLVVLNESGKVISESSHADLKMLHGVCADKSGNIYLSGSLSQNIMKHTQQDTANKGHNATRNGQKLSKGDNMRTVVKAGRVTYPGALWFDREQSRLLVASYPPFGGCDTMKVFSVG